VIDWDALVVGPNISVFGQSVLYQPMTALYQGGPLVANGPPLPIIGVFDEGYQELDPLSTGDMIGRPSYVTSARPVLGVQVSQIAITPKQGDLLTVVLTAQRFVVAEVQPDGHGHALLLLNDA
jgi:hypothetical protein